MFFQIGRFLTPKAKLNESRRWIDRYAFVQIWHNCFWRAMAKGKSRPPCQQKNCSNYRISRHLILKLMKWVLMIRTLIRYFFTYFHMYSTEPSGIFSYPTLTFCKNPATYTKLWNDAPFCGNNTILSCPYFLSYMEACLESNSNQTVSELFSRVTYNASEVFSAIKTDPPGSSPLQLPEDWKRYKDKIVTFQYHNDFGSCLSVDIGELLNC